MRCVDNRGIYRVSMSHVTRIYHTSMSHATRFHAATHCNTLRSTAYYPSAFLLTHCNTLHHAVFTFCGMADEPISHCTTLHHAVVTLCGMADERIHSATHCNTQHHVVCTLCGIADEPISPALVFCLKRPCEIYVQMSRARSMRIVLIRLE